MNSSPVTAAVTAPVDRPFDVVAGDSAGGLLLLCDHATNHVPARYGNLGLPAGEFTRHIAYDPGAAAVTRGLAARLGAPAVLSNFSRLLIDANRGVDDPTLVMRLSDGAVVPGNAGIDEKERQDRITTFHAPYHDAIDAEIGRAVAAGWPPILVSMHSFTPVWRGRPRPWHAGILWDRDPRLALPLLASLRADAALIVGDNEPYSGALPHDTMWRHGSERGLAHALIEIRQDLIADEAAVEQWVARLAPILAELNRLDGIHDFAPAEIWGRRVTRG